MTKKNENKQLIPLLKGSVSTCIANPIILLPFVTAAFIQLLILEILYFSPRFPLSTFFGPIIRTFWGEPLLHYPQNLILLPKLFQTTQIFTYIFISSFLISTAVAIIAAINNSEKITFRRACRQALAQYVHIIIGALLSFGVFYGLYSVYKLVIARALQIRSLDGIFFIIKTVVLQGAPYVNLLIGVFVTALFAFIFPIIMIEKKKILAAILSNFKVLRGSCLFIFSVVLIPTLFYLPVLFMRNNMPIMASVAFPEIRLLVLILSILVMTAVDAVTYMAITTYYLVKRENQ